MRPLQVSINRLTSKPEFQQCQNFVKTMQVIQTAQTSFLLVVC